MTAQNDLDRMLDSWFHGDATAAPPAAPLARAIESTRQVRPRGAVVARLGSSWTDVDRTGVGATLRPGLILALVALLVLALAGGALLAGARLFSDPIKPTPFMTGNGVIAVATDGGIFVTDRPGGDLRPLVTGPEEYGVPRFTPDGTKLVFLRDGALMLADADGSTPFRSPLRGMVTIQGGVSPRTVGPSSASTALTGAGRGASSSARSTRGRTPSSWTSSCRNAPRRSSTGAVPSSARRTRRRSSSSGH